MGVAAKRRRSFGIIDLVIMSWELEGEDRLVVREYMREIGEIGTKPVKREELMTLLREKGKLIKMELEKERLIKAFLYMTGELKNCRDRETKCEGLGTKYLTGLCYWMFSSLYVCVEEEWAVMRMMKERYRAVYGVDGSDFDGTGHWLFGLGVKNSFTSRREKKCYIREWYNSRIKFLKDWVRELKKTSEEEWETKIKVFRKTETERAK
jgi:hypothetical protein